MTGPVKASRLPDNKLLHRYREIPGAYTDCFAASVAREVSASEFIEAFYTTALYRCERFVLRLIGHGSSDADVRALAAGADRFAAWTVEAGADGQIMLCDFARLTRSWLMVSPRDDGKAGAQLFFGSVVVPGEKVRAGNPRPTFGFRFLQPVHAFYARALLRAAAGKLSGLTVDV